MRATGLKATTTERPRPPAPGYDDDRVATPGEVRLG